MSSGTSTGNNPLFRKLLVSLVFILTNIVAWHLSNNPQDIQSDIPRNTSHSFQWKSEDHGIVSGVGLVTTDGNWEENEEKRKQHDIKILGFTDKNYLAISKYWYIRMTALGYTEHHIVAHDEVSYNSLRSDNFRVFPCFIKNPDYAHPIKGIWQQIMSARLHFTKELLENGTHLLITDVDNVFSRYVPLYGFIDEGYDVFHAYEMRYPVPIYNEFGFVVCSGHQFLRSSPETIHFMELVMNRCSRAKCDDQVTYNTVFFYDLEIKWDNNIQTPNHTKALRVNTTHPENAGLLVESVTGRSAVTNHTIKIWDRDFAWRLAGGIPEHCPSIKNWVGMPTKLDGLIDGGNKVFMKIAGFQAWDKHCRLMRYAELANSSTVVGDG